MFNDIAAVYDLLKSHRDYASEAITVKKIIHREIPQPTAVLEVACGTGSLLAYLKGYTRAGIDSSSEMLAQARVKLGHKVGLHCEDMRQFSLAKSDFDALMCMDGALGYVPAADLDRTFASFGRHIAPGGLLILEPWYTPSEWQPKRVHVITHEGTEATVVRVGYGHHDGTIEFHTVIGTPDGIRTVDEHYEFALHTRSQIFTSLHNTGFADLRMETASCFKRGLIIGRRS